MDEKYIQAIFAGIIGGIVVAFIIVLRNALTFMGYDTTAMLLNNMAGLCTIPVLFLAMMGAGMLAIRMAITYMRDNDSPVVPGALAGGCAGIIAEIAEIAMSLVMPYVSRNYYSLKDMLYGRSIGTACCCAPEYLVAGIALGALGAIIYYSIRRKDQSGA